MIVLLMEGKILTFQRDSCFNKVEDGRIEGKEEETAWGKKTLSKLKKPPTLSIWGEDDHV